MAKKNHTAKNRTPSNGRETFAITAPTANSVQLVGDFTHWKQAPVPMKKDKDGIWRANVRLTPGEHHYRFLVDGEWQDDPQCTLRVPNPYGTQDAVRQVA
jgi:1,4-alpha-glucan branching enzyme